MGEVTKIPANNAVEIEDKFFKELYEGHEIPAVEAHIYHVAQEARLFDPNTGEKRSRALVQKYTVAVFEAMKANNGFNGMTTHILHNPELGDSPNSTKITNPTLLDISGIGEAKAKLLNDNGVANIQMLAKLNTADHEILDAVDGLTKAEVLDWQQKAIVLLSPESLT